MPGIRNLSTSARLPSRPNVGSFGKPKSSISSLTRQSGRVSAFRQFGDSVSRTQSGQRSGKIFGSINRAIKDQNSQSTDLPDSATGPKINPAYKPIIK